MKSISTTLARALSMAHLVGLPRRAAPVVADRQPPIRRSLDVRAARSNAGANVGVSVDAEDELHGTSPVALARLRERARCASILAHPAAATHFALATGLAFRSRAPRREALALLDAMSTAQAVTAHGLAATYGARLRDVARPTSGMLPVSTREVIAAGWDRAFAKARSETPEAFASDWDKAFARARRPNRS